MTRIPFVPLMLGLAGLIPFIFGAADVALGFVQDPWPGGDVILRGYGFAIFFFMSGVLWGFATKAEGRKATLAYVASVTPVLVVLALMALGFYALPLGFVSLLAFDYGFARAGLAPPWWMTLRLLLTTVVVLCLLTGMVYA